MTNVSANHPTHRSPVHSFPSITGRHSYSFFELRPDSDVLAIRDYDYESNDLVLSGVLVLCLQSPLRIEDIHLQLTGTLRQLYGYPPFFRRESAASYLTKVAHSSVEPRLLSHKVRILEHRWQPFVGVPGKSMILPSGNYEWPFEFAFPRDTIESVEGIPELSVTYTLKATVGRGKLAHDLHTYKRLRIIRTPVPDALELAQPVSVEDVWSNKIEYSIVTPQKTVLFGGSIPVQMQFSPLLKGLDLRAVTARFIEIRECTVQGPGHFEGKKHRIERVTSTWKVRVTREEFWRDMIEETGQEGWVISKSLELPKELYRCIQDLSLDTIKVRHKLAITVSLHNPDGHTSELLAKLPISVMLYNNIAFDKNGKLTQSPITTVDCEDSGEVLLPVYGEHIHDELYDGQTTPPSLAAQLHMNDQSGTDSDDGLSGIDAITSQHHRADTNSSSSRENSIDGLSTQRGNRHFDESSSEIYDLERVPSYQTALRTPFRHHLRSDGVELPSYVTTAGQFQNDDRLSE